MRIGSRALLISMAVLVAGCASQPAGRPTVTLSQISKVEVVLAASQTAVPVDYRLDVSNPLDHHITLESVEIETVGQSGSYHLKRVRHPFEQIVPARSSATVDIRAWVTPLQDTVAGRIGNAVMLRGSARFDSRGETVRSAFVARFGPPPR